jgi:hypothetical protein
MPALAKVGIPMAKDKSKMRTAEMCSCSVNVIAVSAVADTELPLRPPSFRPLQALSSPKEMSALLF